MALLRLDRKEIGGHDLEFALSFCSSIRNDHESNATFTFGVLSHIYMHALQGALLLVLFNVSHAVEHLLTDKAQGSLASLLEKAPQTATLLQVSVRKSQATLCPLHSLADILCKHCVKDE